MWTDGGAGARNRSCRRTRLHDRDRQETAPHGHYQTNYCRAWRDVLDDFRYHFIDLAPAGDDRIGDVIERVIRVHSLLADHDYYLALPEGARERAEDLLGSADVPSNQVRVSTVRHP